MHFCLGERNNAPLFKFERQRIRFSAWSHDLQGL